MNAVIDTNILKKALADTSLEHISLMFRIRDNNHCITLDFQNKLLDEYNDELAKYPLFRKWYAELQSSQRIFYCDHHIPNKHNSQLLELGLHEPEDLVVLGLALHADKYLITEDSDFGKGNEKRAKQHTRVLVYITSKMYITIHDASEACTRL